MPPAEAFTAQKPPYEKQLISQGPIEYFENLCGFQRFEPAKKIGFADGIKSLATKTRSFFGGLFSPSKKR